MKGRELIQYISLLFKNLDNVMPYSEAILVHIYNFVLKSILRYDLSGKVIVRVSDVKVRYLQGMDFEQFLFKGYQRYPNYIPKRGDIVVDVGAFVGLYSLKAGKLGAFVIAIEPNPIAFIQLLENIMVNNLLGNIVPINVALSDQEGYGYLNVVNTHIPSGKAHLSSADMPGAKQVRLVTFDSLILKKGLSWVDIVKVDVEGHELQVLKGMKESLRKGLVNKLIIEVHTPVKERLPHIISIIKYYQYKIDGIYRGVLYARRK